MQAAAPCQEHGWLVQQAADGSPDAALEPLKPAQRTARSPCAQVCILWRCLLVRSSPATLLRSVAMLRRTAGLQRIRDAVGIAGAISCCALRGANISAAAAADWWRLADAA